MKPRASTKSQDAVDDPCWGDPDHCSLEYLLTLLDRNQTILYESEDYVLINKPADLRMDGPFPSTVHKLITYWYPPPTLQNHPNLLQHISTLHLHSDTPDKQLQVRPCHQLDYATSGVLLCARSTPAAAYASTMFEQRKVQKAYLAVLHGHVPLKETRKVLLSKHVTKFLEQQEDQHKRQQHKKSRPAKAKAFRGFQPPNAFFQIWQGRYARKLGNGKRKRERLDEQQWDQVDKALNLSATDCAKLAALPYKRLNAESTLKDAIKRATDCYNEILKEIIEREKAEEEEEGEADEDDETIKELPPTFCLEGDDPDVFYVYLSMAQAPDDFAMRIPNHTADAPSWIPKGDPSKLNFKVALTKCTILQRVTLNGLPVTKVQLKPRTGRRHQLRVHTAFLGHSIVGDRTYETEKDQGSNLSPRMCLHAHELEFPLPNGQDGKVSVTAPDPFQVSDGGQLTILRV